MIDKVHKTMQNLIRGDLNMMAAYRDEEDKKHPQ